ncbi:MAG: hypothetical protein QM775_31030 [Pirellulales bacterium]
MHPFIPDTPSQVRARHIMGRNFLGLEEVRRGYAIALPVDQLAEIPFSDETLQACKDTHVLVAGAPLSVNEIRTIATSDFSNTDWYQREAFANDKKVGTQWHLLRRSPVSESCNKTYQEQTALLTPTEGVPFACEITYMVILYWRTHRERLLQGVYVNCQDLTSVGERANKLVCVGNLSAINLSVSSGNHRRSYLGLASSVLPDKS